MPKKQVTIKEIAEKLNLHFTTVARALRDHPDVSPKTKELVLKAAKELNYTPNSLARSLKSNRTKTIGVIVPDIQHDFFSSAISGIEKVAHRLGYVIIVCQSNESFEQEKVSAETLASNRVAGLVVSIAQGTKSGEHFQQLIDRGMPIVFFDRVCEDVKASKVVFDDREGAKKATTFLLDRGYRRIVHFAGPQNLHIARERLLGFKAALKAKGLRPRSSDIFFGGLREEDGYKSMAVLLDKNDLPEAIFCVNDPVAIGALQKIKETGLRVPDDIALVGFSNQNSLLSLIDPPLTTVNQPAFAMGVKAAELLLEEIAGRKTAPKPRTEVLRTELVVRESA